MAAYFKLVSDCSLRVRIGLTADIERGVEVEIGRIQQKQCKSSRMKLPVMESEIDHDHDHDHSSLQSILLVSRRHLL